MSHFLLPVEKHVLSRLPGRVRARCKSRVGQEQVGNSEGVHHDDVKITKREFRHLVAQVCYNPASLCRLRHGPGKKESRQMGG